MDSPAPPPTPAGGEISFTGTDTLRIENGKLAEYWADADSLLFFQQLGVAEVPALALSDTNGDIAAPDVHATG